MYLGVIIPPLLRSKHRAIIPMAQAYEPEAKLLYEAPKSLQLAEPTAELRAVMNQTRSSIVPLSNVFPALFGHLSPDAVAQINLGAVSLIELLSILWIPVCPAKLTLKIGQRSRNA
jgi:hypothetical protein